jgi:predicted DNA-binding protein (UPF0278 family)
MNENISKHILNIKEMTKDQPDLSASMNTALFKLRQSEDLMTQIRRQYRAAKREGSVDSMVLWLKLRNVSRDLSNQVLSWVMLVRLWLTLVLRSRGSFARRCSKS